MVTVIKTTRRSPQLWTEGRTVMHPVYDRDIPL